MNMPLYVFYTTRTALVALMCAATLALPRAALCDDEDATPLPERYQGIVTRDPFQDLTMPEAPVPVAPAMQAPTASFAKDISLKGIMEDGDRVRVTFLDRRKNEMFRMYLGSMYEDMELVSVNYDDEEAVLRKGAETCLLSLKQEKAGAATAGPAAAPAPTGPSPSPRPPARAPEGRRPPTPAFPMPDGRHPSYRGKTIDEFLKEHPDAVSQSPSPIRVPDPKTRALGRGMTIEKFFKEHPEAASQFPSPIRPPDPAFKASGKGETIERFLRENPGSVQQIPIPEPVKVQSPEASGENVMPPGQ